MARSKAPGPAYDSLRDTASDLNSGAVHLLRGLRAVDRQAGLTPARLSALSVLVFGGPIPVGRLAKVEGVASPTMTRIVDGLCQLGLARRSDHPDSDTIVLVSATPEGDRLMHVAAARRFEVIIRALTELSATEQATLRAAAPLLRRLASNIWPRPPG